jgi:lactoylglutathione lyase
MNFAYTLLYVKDVKRAVEFYETAFGLQRRFVSDTADYAEMETGGTALGFVAETLAGSNLPKGFQKNDPAHPPAGIEIAFTTPDVQAAFAHAVESGAAAVSEPKTKPWGQVVAYVRDLDGVLVEIASPMA